jgi:hypothetical protein
MSDSPGLGEQVINKAAEIGITSQLDAVENLDVNIETDPLKLVQGQVDSVEIKGEGLVIQSDLRMAEMQMQMTSVAINPLSVAFGKVELTKPTEASVRVILTEADINRAFNSDYVRSQLQNQKIQLNGKLVAIEPQQVNFGLPGGGKVTLNANILLKETSEIKEIAFSAIPVISADGQTVSLSNVEYGNNQEISPELTQALVDATSEILNLSNFDLPGMSLQVKQLDPQLGKLIIAAEAYVEQIPSA